MSVSDASVKISTPTIVLSNIVPINLHTASHPCGGGGGGINDDDDDGFGCKIMISVHRGKKTLT